MDKVNTLVGKLIENVEQFDDQSQMKAIHVAGIIQGGKIVVDFSRNHFVDTISCHAEIDAIIRLS